jgi:hypothetical protein
MENGTCEKLKRTRLLTKINSSFRIVFNTRLGNILQAHGNNSVHGIHLPIARMCCSPQGLETDKIKWAKWPGY